MNRWFRHYAGMMRDDKLVRAAVRAKQPVERAIWVWGAILESASEINDDGRFDFDAAEAAYFLRADEADIRAVVDALADSGRLAEGRVVNWCSRQFQSDRSASRQAAYRERQRSAGSDGDDQQTAEADRDDAAVTSRDKTSDGRVTSLSRAGDAPDTETDTQTEKDMSPPAEARPNKPENPLIDLRDGIIPLAVAAFNREAVVAGWAQVQRLTEPRKTALRARLAECGGLDGWGNAMAKARASPFLTGSNDRGWKADFDFLCKSKSFTKLMEGGYDHSPGQSRGTDKLAAAESFLREAARQFAPGDGDGGDQDRSNAGVFDHPGGPAGAPGEAVDLPPTAYRRAS